MMAIFHQSSEDLQGHLGEGLLFDGVFFVDGVEVFPFHLLSSSVYDTGLNLGKVNWSPTSS